MASKPTRTWKRPAAWAAFALLSFLLALRLTFPAEAVVARLQAEVAASGWQLAVADAGPAGLIGLRLSGVTLVSPGGARVPVERLDAGLRLLPLLAGRRGLDLDAQLLDGRVTGVVEQSSGGRRIEASITGVDLARAAVLREATGLGFAGRVGGEVRLAIDAREPAKSTGRVDLAIDRAAIQGGQLALPGMGGALTVPRVALGTVDAEGAVQDGKLTFSRLQSAGGDLELSGQGLTATLQPRVGLSPLAGSARFNLRPAFWQPPENAKLKPLVELALASGKGAGDAYGLQLFGTLARPRVRLAPPAP